MSAANDDCELCRDEGGEVLFRTDRYRVVLIDDAAYRGFCRVIWNAHVREMTSLNAAERAEVMDAVWRVEAALHEVMQPVKINLASLGNLTAHVHWHVIPRFGDDAHFPQPIWGRAQREAAPEALATRRSLLPQLRQAVARHFADLA